jgi:hypothetical protein
MQVLKFCTVNLKVRAGVTVGVEWAGVWGGVGVACSEVEYGICVWVLVWVSC